MRKSYFHLESIVIGKGNAVDLVTAYDMKEAVKKLRSAYMEQGKNIVVTYGYKTGGPTEVRHDEI